MKIAISTPSGHVGSAVADFLLDFGGDIHVKLLGRRPEKLRTFVERGAALAVGSQDDVNYLVKATEGIDALFWATPPGLGSDDVRAFQNRHGRAAATAIHNNRIPRVVNLSSLGADASSGVGPINGLHDVESRLDDVADNVTHLRAGFFFENLLWQIDAIRELGRILLPITATRRFPMIATRDVGRSAAIWLASRSWSGRNVHELYGPAELSFHEVADILTGAIGRRITYVKCDLEGTREALLNNALSENAADVMLELYDAMETGRLRAAETPIARNDHLHHALRVRPRNDASAGDRNRQPNARVILADPSPLPLGEGLGVRAGAMPVSTLRNDRCGSPSIDDADQQIVGRMAAGGDAEAAIEEDHGEEPARQRAKREIELAERVAGGSDVMGGGEQHAAQCDGGQQARSRRQPESPQRPHGRRQED